MPNIPSPSLDQFQYEPRTSLQEPYRRITPQEEPASLESGLASVADAGDAVAKADASSYAGMALARLRVAAEQARLAPELGGTNTGATADNATGTSSNGAVDHTQAALDAFDKATESEVTGTSQMGGMGAWLGAPGMASDLIQKGAAQIRGELQQRAIQQEAEANVARRYTTALDAADTAATAVSFNPDSWKQTAAEQLQSIQGLGLPAQQELELAQHIHETVSLAAGRAYADRDPVATMQRLNDPKDPFFAGLTPALRMQISDYADKTLHERVADAERVHTLTVQQDEQQRDDIVKQGITMSQGGQLTAGWINQHSALLKPDELNFLYKELDGKGVTSDLHTYADLISRAAGGQDVTEDAKAALYGGRLSTEDFTRLIGMSSKDQPNWYKRGAKFIETAGQVSQLEPDPAKAQTLANMQADWDDWSRANPKATDAQAETEFRGIVNRYQLVQGDQAQLVLPVPRYFVGTRANPDIGASQRALVSAYQSGAINRQEFNREAGMLQRWQHAVDASSTPAAQAGK